MIFTTKTILDLFFYSYCLKPEVHSKVIEHFLKKYKNMMASESITLNFYNYINQTKPIDIGPSVSKEKDNLVDWISDVGNLKERVRETSLLISKINAKSERALLLFEETAFVYK